MSLYLFVNFTIKRYTYAMLQSKLSRYTLALGIIVIASFALYPTTQGEKNLLVWLLLALILTAAAITIKEK
jgi:glucan phosphoethanolaminetransferase (alkaline phosphatase superfamily)